MSTPRQISLWQHALRGIIWTMGLRIVGALSVFALVAILTRLLTAETVGRYFVAISVVGFLSLAVQLGLTGPAVRDVSRALADGREDKAQGIARAILRLAAFAGVSLVSVALLLSMAIPHFLTTHLGADATLVIPIIALTAALLGIQAIVGEIFRGYHRIGHANLLGSILAGVVSLVGVFATSLTSIPISLVTVIAISSAAAALSLTVGVVLLLHGPSAPAPSSAILLCEGHPFWWNSLATFVFYYADLWVAGMVLPFDQVALYGAANRVVQMLVLPIDAAEASLPPLISGLHATNEHASLQILLRRTAQIQTVVVTIGSVVLIVFGSPLLGSLFGAHYENGQVILALLSLGWLVRASMGAYGHTLMMTTHAHFMMRLTLAWSLLCVPIEWIAGTWYGATGIAAAAALLLASFSLVGAWAARLKLGLNVTALPSRKQIITAQPMGRPNSST